MLCRTWKGSHKQRREVRATEFENAGPFQVVRKGCCNILEIEQKKSGGVVESLALWSQPPCGKGTNKVLLGKSWPEFRVLEEAENSY